MTTYNGYELNYSLNKFKTMATKEMTDIKMLSPDSEAYKNLSDADKKVLYPVALVNEKSNSYIISIIREINRNSIWIRI